MRRRRRYTPGRTRRMPGCTRAVCRDRLRPGPWDRRPASPLRRSWWPPSRAGDELLCPRGFAAPRPLPRTCPVHGADRSRTAPASTPPHDLAPRRRAAAAHLADDRSSPPGLHPPRRRSGAVHRVHRHRRGQLGTRGDGGVRDSGRGGAGACPAHHPGHHRPGAIEGSPGMTARELFSEERSAEVVTASFEETPDPRLKQIMTSLVRHLHDFVKDVELTEEEWGVAVDFLTRTGHMSDDVRQEFILLSDVLGVSMLVETINHRTGGRSTESTVLGPFHVVSPHRGNSARTSPSAARVSPARAGDRSPVGGGSRCPALCWTCGRPTTTGS